MKNPFKIVAASALFVSAAMGATPVAGPAVSAQALNFQLTTTETGASVTNRAGTVVTGVKTRTISNKDIITALGGAPGSQLMVLSPITYVTNQTLISNRVGTVIRTNTTVTGTTLGGNPEFVLRQKGQQDIVLTNFTVTPASQSVSVGSSTVNSAGLIQSQTNYRVDNISFISPTLDFTVQGYNTATLGTHATSAASGRIPITDTSATGSNFSGTFGTGTSGGEVGVASGRVSTTFAGMQ